MNKKGPVVVIEDDEDDARMLAEIFRKLNYANEVVFFDDGHKALDYLTKNEVSPFLVLSDVNMPRINGFELRNKVLTDQKLSNKCFPYLFFSTAASPQAVDEAYAISVQGFFVKPNSYDKLQNTIRLIMEYWQECMAPSE